MKKRLPNKPHSFFKDLEPYVGIIVLVSIFIIGYIFYRNSISDKKLLSLSFVPLFLGIIYENRRLGSDWKTLFLKAIGALALSFFAFLPGKNERNYHFETHIIIWPFFFIAIFVFLSIIIHEKKVIPKLTEGMTFLLSISIIYWLIELNVFESVNWWKLVLIIFFSVIAIISFIHAFTYISLSSRARFWLSILSSILMIVFAVDHIIRVFKNDYIENADVLNGTFIALQYFLLGVSSMYILQNIMMLIVYLPSRNQFYDKVHMKEIRNMNKTHRERYSNEQVKIIDSFLALILFSGFYYINYKYKLLPSHTAIWIAIFLFPYLVMIKNLFYSKLNQSNKNISKS